jgi:hypothetical protein
MALLDALTGNDSEEQKYLQQALAQYQNLQAPTTQQLQVGNIPLQSVQGAINPEQVQGVTENPVAVSQVALNPASTQAQTNAIGGEQEIANSGGLDAAAQLGIQQATQASNNALSGNLGAIMQNAQSQGNAGSGAVLAERLSAAQGAANNLQNQDLQAAAEAENNREAALANMGNLGANLTGQNLQASTTNAGQLNQVQAQNTATKAAAENTNVGNNLAAQGTNLNVAQGVNASNAAAGQNQAYYNAQAPQTQFNDQLAKAQGAAGVGAQQAGAANQAATNQANLIGGLAGAAGKIGAASILPGAGPKIAATTAAKGGVISKKLTLEDILKKKRGILPGKEVVKGNSEKNDNIPILASAGELVVDKDTVKKGPEAIKKFAEKPPIAGSDHKVKLEDLFKKKEKVGVR